MIPTPTKCVDGKEHEEPDLMWTFGTVPLTAVWCKKCGCWWLRDRARNMVQGSFSIPTCHSELEGQ